MSLEKILPFTLQWEGGYSDNPADPGGATNYGITQNTYDAYRTSVGDSPQDVKQISTAEVQNIYAQMYWMPSHAADCGEQTGMVLFDTAVNIGCAQAIKLLQTILCIEEDGVFGPLTQKAVTDDSDSEIAPDLVNARKELYIELVQKRPELGQFLNGWTNRCNALQEFITK